MCLAHLVHEKYNLNKLNDMHPTLALYPLVSETILLLVCLTRTSLLEEYSHQNMSIQINGPQLPFQKQEQHFICPKTLVQ